MYQPNIEATKLSHSHVPFILTAHPMTPPLSILQLQEKELKKGVALVASSPAYHQKHVARPSIAFTLIIFNLNIHNKSFSVQLRFQGIKNYSISYQILNLGLMLASNQGLSQ